MTGQPVPEALPGVDVTPRYVGSPARLLAWLDCPRRYRMRYLDRPSPRARPARAHTTIGAGAHAALRDWWLLPAAKRTPRAGADLVDAHWVGTGFTDREQSATWRERTKRYVADYLAGVDPQTEPLGVERGVALRTDTVALSGRLDRLDDRGGQLVVVDYKTGRRVPDDEEARTSLTLALYAAAVWRMFRRRCVRVELHHLPSGTVAAHEHSDDSLTARVREAESIARDAGAADIDFADRGVGSTLFPPRVSALCQWCDYRAHCPDGQAAGPEQPDWAGLEESPVRRQEAGSEG